MAAMRRAMGALLALSCLLPPGQAVAEVLKPGDVVELRIVEWSGIKGEMREWTALKGPFTIAPDGWLDVAFAGRFAAADRNSGDVATDIAARLRETLALTSQVEMRLSIITRAAVILGGLARRPGPVDFQPGMTVRHAVALAGGVGTPHGETSVTSHMAVATELARLRRTEGDLMLRIARLEAERDGASQASFPPAALLGDDGRARIAGETAILALRQQSAARKVELIDSRIALFTAEITTLEEKSRGLDRQRGLVSGERDKVAAMVDRGLALSSRLLEAETRLSAIESQALDVGTAVLRARQSLAAAQNERIQLDETRVTEVLATLQRAESDLSDTRNRLELQRSLLGMALPVGQTGPDMAGVIVTITPASGGKPQVAAWDSPLAPGDLVEIGLAPVMIGGG